MAPLASGALSTAPCSTPARSISHNQARRQQPQAAALGPWQPAPHRRHHRRAPPPPRAGLFGGLFGGAGGSGQEPAAPLETDDGGLMVPLDPSSSTSLDGSSEEPFGPLAMLVVGFTQQEFERLRRLLHEEMEAERVKLVPAGGAALAGSLGAALEAEPAPAWEPAPLGTRRVVFLSGMYAAEVMETMAAMRESGLPEVVFAAAVPNNYHRSVAELVQEVFADHAAMKAQRQRQQQQQQQQQAQP